MHSTITRAAMLFLTQFVYATAIAHQSNLSLLTNWYKAIVLAKCRQVCNTLAVDWAFRHSTGQMARLLCPSPSRFFVSNSLLAWPSSSF